MNTKYKDESIQIDYDLANTWHVYPVNDLKKHRTSGISLCWCNPKIEVQPNKALIIVHNSKDGREFAEKKLILKN